MVAITAELGHHWLALTGIGAGVAANAGVLTRLYWMHTHPRGTGFGTEDLESLFRDLIELEKERDKRGVSEAALLAAIQQSLGSIRTYLIELNNRVGKLTNPKLPDLMPEIEEPHVG